MISPVHWYVGTPSVLHRPAPLDSVAQELQPFAKPTLNAGRLPGRIFDTWHLLSLDAPTVAFVWCVAFAHIVHRSLPLLEPSLLAVATWLLYVADRLLDGWRARDSERLEHRHWFHWRHRHCFLAFALPAAAALILLSFTRMDFGVLRSELWLAACAVFYLLAVHVLLPRLRLRLPKEWIVGCVFAAACAIPAWSRAGERRALVVPVLLFAALAWINCVAIEHWEGRRRPSRRPANADASTRWIGKHLNAACLSLAAAALLAAMLGTKQPATAALDGCVVASALLILCLLGHGHRLPPLRLRALVDAALLTPGLLLLLHAHPS